MSDEQPAPQTESNAGPDDLLAIPQEDGTLRVYARVDKAQAAAFAAQGVPINKEPSAEYQAAALGMQAAAGWAEGALVQRPDVAQDRWLAPKLTVPSNYYTRVAWSKEYMEQESLVHTFVTRDIDQAVKQVEFQMPEDADKAPEAKKVLDQWSTILNEGIQQDGGLHGYNRRSAKRLFESSLIVAIANWGPIEVDGEFYQVPKVIQNLDPERLVPYKDLISGITTYYLKLSPGLAEKLKRTRRGDNAWRQMIPQLGDNIVDQLPQSIIDHYGASLGGMFDRNFYSGPFLRLPPELVYVIRFDGDDDSDYPTPTLVPIFSDLAMKRKLQLADWAVADGMINMLMVFSFPAGTAPEIGKSIVRSSMGGGRVQGLSIPAQVKVELITPPADILNSKDKFWVPLSGILAHFGFPLNSESRGAGDLDSGPLDLSSNIARLDRTRDVLEALNNYWLRQIKVRNKWTAFTPTVMIPRIDLTNSETLRSHVLAVYDRGSISEEMLLRSVGTTLDREMARRKDEKERGVDDILEIRPSFSQTTGVPGDGRTPNAQAKPRGGAKENRPAGTSQSESRS